ncbi:MAG: DUF465 domain-containing protein [Gammaproteobacteria bacterium]|nr:DUF465 domain-containing protein [Gammaproteobacteria bacterium]
MIKRLRSILEALPQHEDSLIDLAKTNPEFDSLCQNFGHADAELRELEQSPEADAESRRGELKRRRAALQDEIVRALTASARI